MDLGDPQTFEQAYEQHHRSVYAAAYRVVGSTAQAQDVTQDVFMRVWRRPDSFDARRGELGSYLRLMARSRALDLWREGDAAGRAAGRLEVAMSQRAPSADARPALACELNADRREVRAALGRLPAPQREAIVLAYWGGLTADQIARRSQVPVGTAKSRIRLGLARLKQECAGSVVAEDALAVAA